MSETDSPLEPETQNVDRIAGNKGLMVLSLILVILINSLDAIVPPAGIHLAVLAIWFILRRRGQGWVDIGFARPRCWKTTVLSGIAIGIVLNLVMSFGVGPMLENLFNQHIDTSRFDVLRGDLKQFLIYLTVSWTTAGFGEEIIWRGFLLIFLGDILGGGRKAEIASLVLMTMGFGLIHLYQGPVGVATTGLVGLVLGVIFLRNGRSLWLPAIIHSVMDTISFTMLYTGFGL